MTASTPMTDLLAAVEAALPWLEAEPENSDAQDVACDLRAAADAVRGLKGLPINAKEIGNIKQEGARDALAPIRECGVTAERLDEIALWLDDDEGGFPDKAPDIRALAAAIRKALGDD